MKDYTKFSAIIIGAGVSTGGALTKKFASMGYHVCPVRRERNFNELESLTNEIQAAGLQATPFGVDARDEDAIKTLFQEVETNIAPIDVVIFNPVQMCFSLSLRQLLGFIGKFGRWQPLVGS